MNSETQPSERYTRIRRALVDLPGLAPASGTRRTRTIVGAAAAAFVLGGALTGGAFAAASTVSAQQASEEASAAGAGHEYATEQDAQLLGTPFTATASGDIHVKLGVAPAGANALVEVLTCLNPGTFADTIDGGSQGAVICGPDDTVSPGVSSDRVTTTGTHVYAVTSPGSASYVLWLSWIKMPTLEPSAAEKAALADGVITRSEYLAAFNQYAGCMAGAGYPVIGANENSSNIQYDTSAAAVSSGADNRCYVTQLKAVYELWDTEDGGINNTNN